MITTLLDSYVMVTIGSHINNHISAEMRAIHPVNSGYHCRNEATKTVLNNFRHHQIQRSPVQPGIILIHRHS